MTVLINQLKHHLIEEGFVAQDIIEAFRYFDINGSGSIDFVEFKVGSV